MFFRARCICLIGEMGYDELRPAGLHHRVRRDGGARLEAVRRGSGGTPHPRIGSSGCYWTNARMLKESMTTLSRKLEYPAVGVA
jgi:hypothetical protein